MKKLRVRERGFGYSVTREQIREYQKLSAEDKLNWLESANKFSCLVIKGKTKRIWEAFRRGEI